MKWLQFIHTLWYLKPVQIVGRLGFFIKKKFFNFAIVRCVKRKSPHSDPAFLKLVAKCYPKTAAQNLKKKQFTFLNVTADYGAEILWNDPAKSRLWLYNLHYFEYLLPLTQETSREDFEAAKIIIEDWIRKNPIGQGNGWEPYPISLRVVNWIFFYSAFHSFFESDFNFRQAFLTSLFRQAAYLKYFLEHHLQANHLWANVKALLFAGLFFNHSSWIRSGAELFSSEVSEQILKDGGHFERSPMYHALILIDLIDLANVFKNSNLAESPLSRKLQQLEKQIEPVIPKMMQWLQAMTHPDGKPALFGDTAFNVAPELKEIKDYFQAVLGTSPPELPESRAIALENSGYFSIRSDELYLLVDGGELGVRYQPGHAHCDLLSYELSYQGYRFVVDSGIGEYVPTELRHKARSIYSHNTLVVNGMDQAEIWSAFRMGRRVHPEKIEIKTKPAFEFFGTYHNRLQRKWAYRHQRRIKVAESITIEDQWQARAVKSVENLIHLHPDCKIELNEGRALIKRGVAMMHIIYNAQKIRSELRDWFYVPEFGKIIPSKVLVLIPEKNLSAMSYSIQLR